MTKKDNILIRINAKLKEKFISKCKSDNTTQSKKLREMIINYIGE